VVHSRGGGGGTRTPTKMIPKRGEVFLVEFDPAVGAEIQKT
jgi:hypothetical protein